MTGYLYIFMAHLMKEAREAMPNVGSSSSQYVLAAIKFIQFNYSHDISKLIVTVYLVRIC